MVQRQNDIHQLDQALSVVKECLHHPLKYICLAPASISGFHREGSYERFSHSHLPRSPRFAKTLLCFWTQMFSQMRYPISSRKGLLRHPPNKEPSIGRFSAHRRVGRHLARAARSSRIVLHRQSLWCGRSSHLTPVDCVNYISHLVTPLPLC